MTISAQSRPSRISDDAEFNDRFWYWQGASGASYIHSVYPAGACPPLPGAIYIAVRRSAHGRRVAIGIGRFDELSQLAGRCLAIAGADELHVHMLARDGREGDRILSDLQAAFRLPVFNTGCTSSSSRAGDNHAETDRHGGFHETQLALFNATPQPGHVAAP
jgi:hypothetical protein